MSTEPTSDPRRLNFQSRYFTSVAAITLDVWPDVKLADLVPEAIMISKANLNIPVTFEHDGEYFTFDGSMSATDQLRHIAAEKERSVYQPESLVPYRQ